MLPRLPAAADALAAPAFARLKEGAKRGRERALARFFAPLRAGNPACGTADHRAGLKLAFGAASVGSTSRGGVSVPTVAVQRSAGSVLGPGNVLLTPEFRTTAVCAECNSHMHTVWGPLGAAGGMRHRQAAWNRTAEERHEAAVAAATSRAVQQAAAALLPPGLRELALRALRQPARGDVRGLRWCPRCERYADRDVNAALNMARVVKRFLQGRPRPPALCRFYPSPSTHRRPALPRAEVHEMGDGGLADTLLAGVQALVAEGQAMLGAL